jgi:outer membrane protein assembly factor BamB
MPHWDWNALSRGYYEKRVPWGFGITLFAYDLKEHQLRWVHQEEALVDSRGMAMGGGGVFFYAPGGRVSCIDDQTGDVLWYNDNPEVLQLIEQRGHGIPYGNPGFRSSCFTLYTPEGLYFQAQSRQNLVALSVEDGQMMWNRERTSNSSNVIYTDNHLFVGIGPEAHTMKLDPSTGETIEDLGFEKGAFCTRLTATTDSFFQRGFSDGINRYDRLSGKMVNQYAPRPGCNDGVIGANGLLYVGPWLCDCAYTLIGRISLCSAGDFEFEQPATETDLLERSTTDLFRVTPLASTEQDWHAYRGGNRHDGSSTAAVSLSVCPIWHAQPQFDTFPTAPVTAGGVVFLGGDDGKVRAYDTLSGSLLWQFRTAGPILQPPSIWEGRLYVGSGDGAIYCLEAASGRMLWRFRAVPIERRIMVYGSLSSTWPVNTGVLVHDGVAYAAAGIIDYDGTYIYALDAETGAIRWQNISSGHLNRELRRGVSAQGNMTMANGKLWMGAGNTLGLAPFDPKTGTYLGPEVGENRRIGGEELGVFSEDFLLHGGRLRYSPVEPIVNAYRFKFYSNMPNEKIMEKELTLSMITPAWDAERLVYLSGQTAAVPGVPRAMDAARIKAHLKDPGEHPFSEIMWEAAALHTMELNVLGLALAGDAVLAIATKPQPRTRKKEGWLLALDRDNGAILWEERLQAEPRLGGLCIDRDGRIFVSMTDGGLACFTGGAGLEAHVNRLLQISHADDSNKPYAFHNLRSWIKESEHAADLDKIAAALSKLGDNPHEPESQGYLNRWKVIGPFPYDEFENNLERSMVGEPTVDLEQIHGVDGRALRWKDRFGLNQQGVVGFIGNHAEPPTAYYTYAECTLMESRPLQLKLGTNFDCLLWWNAEPVHTPGKPESRRIAPGTTLPGLVGKKGVNRILIKTIQPWWRNATFVGIQVLDPDGEPVNLGNPA